MNDSSVYVACISYSRISVSISTHLNCDNIRVRILSAQRPKWPTWRAATVHRSSRHSTLHNRCNFKRIVMRSLQRLLPTLTQAQTACYNKAYHRSGNDVEGSGHGLISRSILAFAWRDWGKTGKAQSGQPVCGPTFEAGPPEDEAGRLPARQRQQMLSKSCECSNRPC
jgi:hypothetical protein